METDWFHHPQCHHQIQSLHRQLNPALVRSTKKKRGRPSAVGFPHCAGSGEGFFLSTKPYPHKCVEAGAWTRDLPVTDGRLYRCNNLIYQWEISLVLLYVSSELISYLLFTVKYSSCFQPFLSLKISSIFFMHLEYAVMVESLLV